MSQLILSSQAVSTMLSDLSRLAATTEMLRDQLLTQHPDLPYHAVAALIADRLGAFTDQLDRMSIEAAAPARAELNAELARIGKIAVRDGAAEKLREYLG